MMKVEGKRTLILVLATNALATWMLIQGLITAEQWTALVGGATGGGILKGISPSILKLFGKE